MVQDADGKIKRAEKRQPTNSLFWVLKRKSLGISTRENTKGTRPGIPGVWNRERSEVMEPKGCQRPLFCEHAVTETSQGGLVVFRDERNGKKTRKREKGGVRGRTDTSNGSLDSAERSREEKEKERYEGGFEGPYGREFWRAGEEPI